MSNLQNCAKMKEMTATEAAAALKMLAAKIHGPVGFGVLEGSLAGKIGGQAYSGEQVAVLRVTDLVVRSALMVTKNVTPALKLA